MIWKTFYFLRIESATQPSSLRIPTCGSNRRLCFFTFEKSEHPNKFCDQESQIESTAYFTSDSMTMMTDENIVDENIEHEAVVHRIPKDIDFDSFVDYVNSTDNKGLNHRCCEMMIQKMNDDKDDDKIYNEVFEIFISSSQSANGEHHNQIYDRIFDGKIWMLASLQSMSTRVLMIPVRRQT